MREINKIILIILLLLGHSAYANNGLPDFSQLNNERLGSNEENLIGNALMRQIRQTGWVDDDLLIQAYIEHLGNNLVIHAPKTRFNYYFFPIRDKSINAFAFFGGHVAIHRGLISATKNESQLAAVLCHEIAHVAKRHLFRQMQEQNNHMPLTVAELLAVAVVAVLGAPGLVPQLTTAVLGGHMQRTINFTRLHEREADYVGIQILAKANYDPHALADFLYIMQQASRHEPVHYEYLSTHPLFHQRLSEARQRAEEFPYRQTKNSIYYTLIKARIIAENNYKNYEYRQVLINKYQKNPAQLNLEENYTLALILAHQQKFNEAIELIKKIDTKYPNNFIVKLSEIEILIANNQLETALNQAKILTQEFPSNRAVHLTYAKILLQDNQPTVAKTILINQLKYNPNDPEARHLLAQTYSQLQQKIPMHQEFAEWYMMHNEFERADKQLAIAIEIAHEKNPPNKKIIISSLQAKRKEYTSIREVLSKY